MALALSNAQIAKAIRCPEPNVAANWPKLATCLDALGMASDNCHIAALATVAVETAWSFQPIHEYGSREYFIRHYDGRADLGNSHPGDGYRYAGRGFIQITGALNYEHYGKLLGIDLIDDPNDPNDDADPDKAMLPDVAAAIFAAYFHERKVYVPALAEDWLKVRRLVNGGYNGLDEFLDCIANLKAALQQSA